MGILITVITVILVFCSLILSHELGHFLAAKACGIFVEDFSLGMGPKLLQKKGKETTYTLRLIPIGGSCNMRGEDEESDDARGFNNKKVWQRMLTIFAGPLANFIFAFLLFIITFAIIGEPTDQNIVGKPIEDTPAAEVLQKDDVITNINGTEITNWAEIGEAINAGTPGQSIYMQIERDGEVQNVVVEPFYTEEDGRWKVGIEPVRVHYNIFSAISRGFTSSIETTVLVIQTLWQMITGQIETDVAGPVGIVTIIGQTATQTESASTNLMNILYLTGLLSINLGIINLIPLPALDGSRLVFLAIEGIRRKPISRNIEGTIHFVGLLLLFGLIILITVGDVMRIAGG